MIPTFTADPEDKQERKKEKNLRSYGKKHTKSTFGHHDSLIQMLQNYLICLGGKDLQRTVKIQGFRPGPACGYKIQVSWNPYSTAM